MFTRSMVAQVFLSSVLVCHALSSLSALLMPELSTSPVASIAVLRRRFMRRQHHINIPTTKTAKMMASTITITATRGSSSDSSASVSRARKKSTAFTRVCYIVGCGRLTSGLDEELLRPFGESCLVLGLHLDDVARVGRQIVDRRRVDPPTLSSVQCFLSQHRPRCLLAYGHHERLRAWCGLKIELLKLQ